MKKRLHAAFFLILTILSVIMLLTALNSCDITIGESGDPASNKDNDTNNDTNSEKQPKSPEIITEDDYPVDGAPETLWVIFDFTNGDPDGVIIDYSSSYYFDRTIEDWIIDMLSYISGFDFSADIGYFGDGKATVDWSKTSTLITGSGNIVQEEPFMFPDDESMRWFMMDSMRQTLMGMFDVEEIYYTMDGGKELAFDKLYPMNVFPPGLEYMGSPYYFAHDDGKGEDFDFDFGQDAVG